MQAKIKTRHASHLTKMHSSIHAYTLLLIRFKSKQDKQYHRMQFRTTRLYQ